MDLSSLFSNPTLLILLAVVALSMFGGGSLNLTELIMSLLQSLKLVPQPKGKASEQVFRGYTRKAWETLQAGNLEGTKDLLLAGMQATEAEIASETAIAPQGIMDTVKEWMKSPIFLIAIAVGAFLIFGGGSSCKKTDPTPAPQEQEVDAEPASYENLSAAWDRVPSEPSWRLASLLSPNTATEINQACQTPVALCGWWKNGPVRKVVSAPVRGLQAAKPVRRGLRLPGAARPINWRCSHCK